ncbi:helix-turn-helix domain-containing protein [Vagococcus intermedius]|uniref:Helix-turn-helix domain-containing protein n=1 Tax=Vagococcus intermedius TaxID=2991418 RepID=A0AAF0I7Q5_9ENTE|nr:helix-turn-helix transcriptional regulator [Vagococcus intermedius]WEG73499.1 helix-turn-helix domain-containing protein [Vagococcus intermedius]WEG75581.1 helix-turn-helix domain-containing protein [Vagococcus intermedius]
MSDLNQPLIERIKQLRKRYGISQEKLSLLASLDARYVNKLENGKFNLSVPTLDRIIKAFDMSYNEFFEFDVKENRELDRVKKLNPKERENLLIQCLKISDLLNDQ